MNTLITCTYSSLPAALVTIYVLYTTIILLLIIYNRRLAILNRVLYYYRTLTLNTENSAALIKLLETNSACKSALTLYR